MISLLIVCKLLEYRSGIALYCLGVFVVIPESVLRMDNMCLRSDGQTGTFTLKNCLVLVGVFLVLLCIQCFLMNIKRQ